MRVLIDLKIPQKFLLFPLCGLGSIILFFLPVFLWNQVLCAQSIEDLSQDNIQLVWSADYGQGDQVFYSSYEKNTWTTPVQLSDSTEMVFHSAISSGDDGKIWAVWTRQDKKKSFLEFTVYNSSKWTKPSKIDTGMDSNKAVTIIVDKNNIAWIAWTGIEKMYSDVFWSRWNGQGWDLPVKIHADNNVPDIKPTLALSDSGQVFLSWKTFANGQYETMTKMWDGQEWQTAPNDSVNMMMNKGRL